MSLGRPSTQQPQHPDSNDDKKAGKSLPEGQPMPDHAETDAEKLAREAERGLDKAGTAQGSGLASDAGSLKQDAPGRPKSASSRQQTQPDQNAQTGSAALDRTAKRRP